MIPTSSPQDQLIKLCSLEILSDQQFAYFRQLAHHKDVNINLMQNNVTPLLLLCWKHKSLQLDKCVGILLQRNDIDINARDSGTFWNALAMTCRYYPDKKIYKVLGMLLEHRSKLAPNGIDVNAVNHNGINALMALCSNYKHDNIIDIVRLLVENGININATSDDMGWNALVTLCYNYRGKNLLDVVNYLLTIGPPYIEVNLEENKGDNALIAACDSYRHASLLEIVRLLVTHHIDINWNNPKLKCNALITLCASTYGKSNLIEIIQFLLDNQIDINATTADGTNCLLAFAIKQHSRRDFINIVQLLIRRGIDVNHRNNSGTHILHLLCKLCKVNDLLDILRRVFLDSTTPIDCNVKDYSGKTPLDYLHSRRAVENKQNAIQFLESKNLN